MTLSAIPQKLQKENHWVCWKSEKRNGKFSKIPYDVKTDTFAKSNDPNTWTNFNAAVEHVGPLSVYDGVGFMLHGSKFVGIDFDGVVDNGVPEPYVLNILELLGNPYSEISPSGTGIHVIIECPKLPPGGRKFNSKKKGVEKYGAEIYAGSEAGRYFATTGDCYAGKDIPVIENLELVYFLISRFADDHFRRLWLGDSSDYENDDSRVDLALLGVLARSFSGNVEKMTEFFNHSVPGHRDKWIKRKDYRDVTINKATSGMVMSNTEWKRFVEQPRKIIEFHETPSDQQKETWTAFDYVIQAADGQFDGWFPLGSPSLVGGSSGSGKTTWMLDMCVKQAVKAPFYGHETFGRSYLVLMLDRGKDSHTRTMRRLGFVTGLVPIKFLEAAVDGEASQQIIDSIEQTTPIPQIVFVEGIDMLVSDPNSLEVVMPFMHEIQQIATHFHIAIIGSCGAPKSKPKEGYAAKRDTIFGSAVWSRMSETVVTLQYPEGDDTADKRIISVLPRNARSEQFDTEFVQGKLAISEIPEIVTPKLTQSQVQAISSREKITYAIQNVLHDGQKKAGWVHDQLKELFGITSPKMISEVSAEMVRSGILLKKSHPNGGWIWELSGAHATLSEARSENQMEFTR